MNYFDLHCDTIYAIAQKGGALSRRRGHIDLERVRCFDHYAQVFALFCGSKPLDDGQEAHQLLQKLLDTAQKQFADNADCLLLCRNAEDFARAEQQRKIAAFLSIEGAELIQSEEDFHMAIDAGVRMITLSWNHDSLYACGAMSDPQKGLTAEGKRLVKALDQYGIVSDVSHLSECGFWELMELVQGPVVATHSNSAAVCAHRRNITDRQFCELCRRGGLIGLNGYTAFVTASNPAAICDFFPHIDHWMELGGQDHLAIGADFDGCDRLPEGLSDVCGMMTLQEEMRRHGYKESLIQALFYENAARFVRQNF